jgi:3-methylornithyl-N6-L-lysine dehydrogenase
MTRLTEDDVRGLIAQLSDFDAGLRRVAGVGLADVAYRAAGLRTGEVTLAGRRVAAVPVSTGEGVIPAFGECIATIAGYLGADAFVTALADVRGLQEAADRAAEVVFLADDERFIALGLRSGVCADDDPCTANGYVAALELAARGLAGRDVLLLGLGPVGRAAGRRLLELGARVLVVERDAERARPWIGEYGGRLVTLREGLAATHLVFDATPAADLVDADQVDESTLAAVPGVPSAFTAAAQAVLGPRHMHEPLAVGVAVMLAEALSGRVSPRA